MKMKNLIVYYSYEGNSEVISVDVLKIVPKKENKKSIQICLGQYASLYD